MAKILLYTVDIDVPGLPIGGGMLRVRQLRRLLSGLGHEVTVSMPLETALEAGASDEVIDAAHVAHDPSRVALDLAPDIVVCAQWHLVPALGALEGPIWLDLHGSLLAENAFRHEGGSESAARYGQEVLAKLAAFGRADVVTCTGARQRLYFRGWKAISGGTYNDWEVVHLPLSLQPEADLPAPNDGAGLRFLFAGNLWPWIDLGSWLPEFFDIVAERPHDEVHFYVDDPVDRRDGLSVIAAAGGGPGFERLTAEGRCAVAGRLGHEAYRGKAREFDIALDLFGPNLERELAVTTRTLEYLSFGIPVLYPQHAELSSTIEEQGCGWVVDPLEPGAVGSVLAEIDCDAVRQRTIAARTSSALESLEFEALSRCKGALERILTPTGGRRTLDGERRFETRLGAGAVEDLRATRRRLVSERKAGERLARELEEQKENRDDERSEFERRLGDREGRVRDLEAERDAARKRVADLELAVAEGQGCARALQQEADAAKQRAEELDRVVCDRDQRIAALGGELVEERRRRRDERAWDEARIAARQVGLAVRSAAPRLGRRGIGRRLRLAMLYVDHIVTRGYLAFWQRIRRQRIFPGM